MKLPELCQEPALNLFPAVTSRQLLEDGVLSIPALDHVPRWYYIKGSEWVAGRDPAELLNPEWGYGRYFYCPGLISFGTLIFVPV